MPPLASRMRSFGARNGLPSLPSVTVVIVPSRLRLLIRLPSPSAASNVFGTKAVTFDDVFVGLQMGGPALVKGSNQPVTFGGKASLTVAPGSAVWSDGVQLGFVRDPAELAGRRLAISFHVAGESGPMTWHAKALTTSYVTAPGAGSKGKSEDEAAFPYSTASWFFLDAVEMMAPADSFAIVAFGDSITDGTASTMNGDDRWPDV